jgi:hypothetical protein
VWMLPNDFGKALEGFAKALGAPGDDGVFRYEPPAYEPPTHRDDDEDEIAKWFDTSTDPKVAEAVRAAEAVARQQVPSPMQASRQAAAREPYNMGDDDRAAAAVPPPAPPSVQAPPPAPEVDYSPPAPDGDYPPPAAPPAPGGPFPARPSESTELSDDPPRY